MNIEIYRLSNTIFFLAVPAGDAIPDSFVGLEPKLFKRLKLRLGQSRICIDQAQAQADLVAWGWHCWDVTGRK